MREMKVSHGDVLEAVVHPETCYTPLKYPNCKVATGGAIAVAYNPDDRVIITVLWRGMVFDRYSDWCEKVEPDGTPEAAPLPKKSGGKGKVLTDVPSLMKEAERQGFTFEMGKQSKYVVRDPQGQRVEIRLTYFHLKAGDWKYCRLLRSTLRKHGFVEPD